jgi:uncharacterized DUF497 family protein
VEFEWDTQKADENFKKHGVEFIEAAAVFADPLSITVADPDHSERENRFITVGYSNRFRPLLVSYTDNGDQVRIISARQLTSAERKDYEEERNE